MDEFKLQIIKYMKNWYGWTEKGSLEYINNELCNEDQTLNPQLIAKLICRDYRNKLDSKSRI